MVRNKLCEMHGSGSSFLGFKWDVPFTKPGVTDATACSVGYTQCSSLWRFPESRSSRRHCHGATHGLLGEKTHTTDTYTQRYHFKTVSQSSLAGGWGREEEDTGTARPDCQLSS